MSFGCQFVSLSPHSMVVIAYEQPVDLNRCFLLWTDERCICNSQIALATHGSRASGGVRAAPSHSRGGQPVVRIMANQIQIVAAEVGVNIDCSDETKVHSATQFCFPKQNFQESPFENESHQSGVLWHGDARRGFGKRYHIFLRDKNLA